MRHVSIHALLAECDVSPTASDSVKSLVSIHALLAECDSGAIVAVRCIPGFNPRTPCGVRPGGGGTSPATKMFQSTHSLRSATFPMVDGQIIGRFQSTHSLRSATSVMPLMSISSPVSIHALLAECDVRRPSGGWTGFEVSIHALLAECDCARPYTLLLNKANHTLRQPP